MNQQTAHETETVLVMNPESGRGDHTAKVRSRASLMDYTLVETEQHSHAVELAREKATAVDEIIAVGGDGTVNEVVRGIDEAGELQSTTVGIIPTGERNDFATSLGITGIEAGFRLIEDGQCCQIDLGVAGETPFLDSFTAGITAQTEPTSEMRTQFGVLADVLTTLRTDTREQVRYRATVADDSAADPIIEDTATVALVGNSRTFSLSGARPTNAEDGLLDVTVIEETDASSIEGDQLARQLLHGEETNLTTFRAKSIELAVEDNENISFSLDGEFADARSLAVTTRKQALNIYVGDSYESVTPV